MPIEPRELRYAAAFLRQLKQLTKKYRRIRDDLKPVLDQLQAGETPGDQIQRLSDTAYKVRVANRDARRGTRGGYRVLYCIHAAQLSVLVAIYSKTEQADISAAEIVRILQEELGA